MYGFDDDGSYADALYQDEQNRSTEPPRCDILYRPVNAIRERRCQHPATITIDGRNLCGVHARTIIHQKQFIQRDALDRPARMLRSLDSATDRKRDDVGRYLVDQVEREKSPTESFRIARNTLDVIHEQYVADLRSIVETADAALAANDNADYPVDTDDRDVVGCRFIRDRAQRMIDERNDR